MADEPDVAPIFRNAFEARAPEIVAILDEPALTALPVRFPHLRSFDYTQPGKLVVTCWEAAGGRPLVFEVNTKTGAASVDREFRKAITAYDRLA